MRLRIPDVGTFEDDDVHCFEGVGFFAWPEGSSLEEALELNKFRTDPLFEAGDLAPVLTLYGRDQPPAYLIQVCDGNNSVLHVGSQSLLEALKLMAALVPLSNAVQLSDWQDQAKELIDITLQKLMAR